MHKDYMLKYGPCFTFGICFMLALEVTICIIISDSLGFLRIGLQILCPVVPVVFALNFHCSCGDIFWL